MGRGPKWSKSRRLPGALGVGACPTLEAGAQLLVVFACLTPTPWDSSYLTRATPTEKRGDHAPPESAAQVPARRGTLRIGPKSPGLGSNGIRRLGRYQSGRRWAPYRAKQRTDLGRPGDLDSLRRKVDTRHVSTSSAQENSSAPSGREGGQRTPTNGKGRAMTR